MTLEYVDRSRANFDASLSALDLRTLLDDPHVRTLQTSTPVPQRTWKMLDRDFFSQRPEVELRVYGHYGAECDLSFCKAA